MLYAKIPSVTKPSYIIEDHCVVWMAPLKRREVSMGFAYSIGFKILTHWKEQFFYFAFVATF